MIFIALFLSLAVSSWGLPSDVKMCSFDDNECLLTSANYVLKNHFAGHPDLFLEPVDPLKIDDMTVQQDSGAINIFARLTNFGIAGFSTAKIYKFSGLDKGVIDLRMRVPSATLTGPYNINGKILILPVNGSGMIKLNFKNFDLKMKLPVAKESRNGKTFLKIEKPEMTFDIIGGDVNLSHLGVLGNTFLNSNFNTIINTIKPSISKSLVEKFVHKINSVFSAMSHDELFLLP